MARHLRGNSNLSNCFFPEGISHGLTDNQGWLSLEKQSWFEPIQPTKPLLEEVCLVKVA